MRTEPSSSLVDDRRLPFKGHRFWKLILTTCRQPTGAPVVDDAWINDQEGHRYKGKSILLMPWRKNAYGEHAAQRAFTVGWRES